MPACFAAFADVRKLPLLHTQRCRRHAADASAAHASVFFFF